MGKFRTLFWNISVGKSSNRITGRRILLESLDKRELLAADASVGFELVDDPTLIGERVGVEFSFSNQNQDGAEVGFGPYVDLVIPSSGVDGDDGLHFVSGSSSLLNSGLQETILEFDEDGKVEHPFARDSAGNPLVFESNPGDQLVVLTLPIGSYVGDQPALNIEFEVDIDSFADVGVVHSIDATAGYRFGQDALDNPESDPMVRGETSSLEIVPEVVLVDVDYLGPEDETAVGPNFVQSYSVTVDVAEGIELSNLNLKGLLDSNQVFMNLTSSDSWDSISTPESGTISEETLVELLRSSLVGKAGVDASYQLSFYVSEHDTAGEDTVSPITGQHVLSEFQVSTETEWIALDERDRGDEADVISTGMKVAHELEDQAVAVQSSVRISKDYVSSGLSPEDILEYTLDFQVADHVFVDGLTLASTVPDGQKFLGVEEARLTLYGVDGGELVSVPFTSNSSGPLSPVLPGAQTVIFDIASELETRGYSSIIAGGTTSDGLGQAVYGKVTFLSEMLDDFSRDFPSGDSSVDEGDRFIAPASITGQMIDPASGEATSHTTLDDSSNYLRVPLGVLATEVYAINGSTDFDEPVVSAEDEVTLRIRRTVRSSDIESLVITDYLPMPVLETDSMSFNSSGSLSVGQVTLGPSDTFHAVYSSEPDVRYDAGRNMIEFDYGSFDSDKNETTTIDLLVTVSVADKPFADGLWLTSHANTQQGSTNNGSFAMNALADLQYTRPVIELSKGAVASTNDDAKFSTSRGPGNIDWADAGSSGTFSGVFANGSTAVDANVSNVDAGDIVRIALTAENVGLSEDGAFELQLRDTIPAGYQIPASGLNLRVQDGSGNDLDFVSVDSNDAGLFGAGIEVQTNIADVSATDGSNFVVVTYDLEVNDAILVGQSSDSTAEVLKYTAVAEGENYVTSSIEDDVVLSVALPEVTHSLISTDQEHTSGNRVVIGENATYRMEVTLPEGTTADSQVVIQLPRGLALQDLKSIAWSEGVTFGQTAEEILASAVISGTSSNARDQARLLTLKLGDMVNSDSDNAVVEKLTLEYVATATNDTSNNNGGSRSATATFTHTLGSDKDGASVKVAEPKLAINRSFSSSNVDADDKVTVTVDVTHSSSSADAFDLVFSETFPDEWQYVADSFSVSGADENLFSVSQGDIRADISSLELGQTIRLTYDVIVASDVSAGEKLSANASVTWTSLSGDPGQINENNELAYERTGDSSDVGGSANDYRASRSGTIQVHAPELNLKLVESSADFTSGSTFTIGELATYELVVQIPEGHHELSLDMLAPFGSNVLAVESIELISVGENLELENSEIDIQDADADGKWSDLGVAKLGRVVNTADNVESDADELRYRLQLRVVDEAANQDGDSDKLVAKMNYVNGVADESSGLQLAEPGVVVKADPLPNVDATDTIKMRVVFSHNPDLGSDPQAIKFVGETITDGLSLVPGSVNVTAGEVVLGNEAEAEQFGIEIEQLKPGESVELTLELYVAADADPGDVLKVAGETQWMSLNVEQGRTYSEKLTLDTQVNSAGLSGWVFVDENQDGVRASVDTGLAGSKILLSGEDHLGNQIDRDAVVSPTGFYEFTGLRPGTYGLSQEIQTDFQDGNNYAGSLGGEVLNDEIQSIVIPAGTNSTATEYNFTEATLTWISGTVFFDSNQNGSLGTGEEGIPGVLLELTGISDEGNEVNRIAATNSRGYFVFGALPSGTYSIHETQPEGYFDSVEELGTRGGEVGEDLFKNIKVGSGTPGEYYNFAEYEPATIEGQVYLDFDRDLVRDRKDGLIQGVPVKLTGVNDLGEEIEVETETDLEGRYAFEGLRPGEYQVTSEAVSGFDRGASNVGVFLGGSSGKTGAGVEYGFKGIELPAGAAGQSYDLGHLDPNHTESILVDGLDKQYVFNATSEDDVFTLRFTTESAIIGINGVEHQIAGGERAALRVYGSFGKDAIQIQGSEFKEEINIRDTSAKLSGTWFSTLIYGMEQIDFVGGGNEDLVRFYDTPGNEHLSARPFEAEFSGDGFKHSVKEIHRIYAFGDAGGVDSASVSGSDHKDSFAAEPGSARMFDGDYYIGMESFENITATANDDSDRAYLTGSTLGVDVLDASEDSVSLTSDGYSFIANGFKYVAANGGTGGEDYGKMLGSTKTDTLNSETTHSTFDINDDGTRVIAKGFEELDVYGNGGDDKAFMNDSHYDDVFMADSESATMKSPVSRTTAHDFDRVTAYAEAGGQDLAELSGSNGQDVFKAWVQKWEMKGVGYVLGGHGFTQVVATANDSQDKAYLYDSEGSDVLEMWSHSATISGERFSNSAVGFNKVVAEAGNGGFDRAVFNDDELRSTVRYDGEKMTVFGNGFSNNAIGFSVVDAIYETLHGNDRVELSEDLQLELIAEDISELYRLSMAAGSDGQDDTLRDRVSAIPVRE